ESGRASDPDPIPVHEINRSLAKRWFHEVWRAGKPETIDELFHPHGVGHIEGRDVGPTEFKAVRDQLLTAFPDLLIEVEDTAADGEHVVVRWRASATHLGNALGFTATQRRVAFRGMTWLTFRAGRIVE